MRQVNRALLGGAICFVALLVVSGCSRGPHLYPRVLMDGAWVGREFFLMAPNVLVASVRSVKLLGPDFPLSPRSTLRLARINADVETIIAGGLRPGAVTFYGFVDRPWYKEFRIRPESRYVLFLREDAGVLRTMADPDGDELQMHSGLHDTADLPDPRSTAERIMPCVHEQVDEGRLVGMRVAYVVLTPGRRFNPESMAQHLEGDLGKVWSRAPLQYVALLLKELQSNGDAGVRAAACIALAEYAPGDNACLVDLAKGPDAALRKRAEERLRVHDENIPRLIERLKMAPHSLSPDVVDLAGRLELLTTHRNDRVRSLACKALRNFFPTCSFPECSNVRLEGGGQGLVPSQPGGPARARSFLR